MPTRAASDPWLPLPQTQWNAAAARHLLRRAGWSATPAETARAEAEGLLPTLDRLFPTTPTLPLKPESIAKFQADAPAMVRRISAATGPDKRLAQRELRERAQQTLFDLSLRWLQFAVRPENAASAKWTLFLGDVYVVAAQKVKNPALIWQHFDLLGRNALGPAPALAKAVSRSPAMVEYLDLNQNRADAPNENFARELFELFLLGEGHYTERDIKESARAFTGYRARLGEFRFVRAQHDNGTKTIFNHTGAFTGDDVINLAYRQPAAATFLPHELVKFYLSDTPVTDDVLAPLGDWWRDQRFDLRALALRFFGSSLFFAPEYRGNFIKSPVQLYLGLLQDLALDVTPLPRQVLNPLRQMGQTLYNPPNVRGWIGGRNWINSATLAARRRLVEALFVPINEERLNADEQRALAAARAGGAGRFEPSPAQFAELTRLAPAAAAERLTANLLALPVPDDFRQHVSQFLGSGPADEPQHLHRARRTVAVLLQSPEYQLC